MSTRLLFRSQFEVSVSDDVGLDRVPAERTSVSFRPPAGMPLSLRSIERPHLGTSDAVGRSTPIILSGLQQPPFPTAGCRPSHAREVDAEVEISTTIRQRLSTSRLHTVL